MIPKSQILDISKQQELRPTTIEKDYVLGWLLFAIAQHERLRRWIFKGGTCLKKCFFETYRFSEDLDFTIPEGEALNADTIRSGLVDVAQWIEEEAGIQFPRDGIDVEMYKNPRGNESFQARVTYIGPLELPRHSLQRVKFDLTQDELVVDKVDYREISHPYQDEPEVSPKICCYSVNEILAEKTRALYEREGRTRDIYDIVHLNRIFRQDIDARKASDILEKKFAFKGLPKPSVQGVVERIDIDTLRANWTHQLGHQLPVLPPVDGFFEELKDSIAWWLEPELAAEPLGHVSEKPDEKPVPRQLFPQRIQRVGRGERVGRISYEVSYRHGAMERIRYAARNRLCARVVYHGVPRTVEPYSLRYPKTGNTLLYVFEQLRGNSRSMSIKAFKVDEIESASVTDLSFSPRYVVEL